MNAQAMYVSNAQWHSLTLAGRLFFNFKKSALMHDIKPHLSGLTTNSEVMEK